VATQLREEMLSSVRGVPSAPIEIISPKSKKPLVTIQDRLEHGNLSVAEVCALANRSKTGFYADLKAGLVSIRKIGRKSLVPGPVARRYALGESAKAA
jgi:hypothetical protein